MLVSMRLRLAQPLRITESTCAARLSARRIATVAMAEPNRAAQNGSIASKVCSAGLLSRLCVQRRCCHCSSAILIGCPVESVNIAYMPTSASPCTLAAAVAACFMTWLLGQHFRAAVGGDLSLLVTRTVCVRVRFPERVKCTAQAQVPSKLDSSETLTQNNGTPIFNNSHSTTVGPRGPVLLDDMHLANKLGQFNREKIPERVVHARGMTAKGYFEVSSDRAGRARCCAACRAGCSRQTPRTPCTVIVLRPILKYSY